ncbi:MAG TPA: response regulator, partial [Gemmataceae bacterium]|nr:response regulator [Gemmataceae bacterium]
MSLILLVEDHPINRKLLRDILQLQFQVVEAESAEKALDLLQRHSPDLIMMDMQLPGMDGLSLVRRLKTNPKQATIPIIAVSAHALPRD